jgi:hypothetical protein
VWAQSGDDHIILLRGDDTAHGGDGNDTIDYFECDQPVIVNLTEGAAHIPFYNEVDYLMEIEYIIGTQYADVLVGDHIDNHFNPLGGNNSVNGRRFLVK